MGDVARVVIAPHCDDETLGCGGLLAKYPDECGVIVLAAPDKVREKEFTRAQEILGYQHSHFLGIPDGQVSTDERGLVAALDAVLAEWQPRELYVPFPSMHQDHIAAYEGGMRTARLSMTEGHHYVPSVLVYDVAVYDTELYPTDIQWNLFEPLEEWHVDRKVEALEAYASQAVTGPHPANAAKQQAGVYGSTQLINYAERYGVKRLVRV